jgi:hypothetical protein
VTDFFYDCAEGRFYGPQGEVTGAQILEETYALHCSTLGLVARSKAWLRGIRRNAARRIVWRGQDGCLWLLEHGYDVKPKQMKGSPFAQPFRIYKRSDFVRSSDEKGSHFFGFQSSKRSLFSNLVILVAAVACAYIWLPQAEALRFIYRNTPLSTVALVFVFLMADQVVPLLLIVTVCGLSRLRAVFF